MGCDDTQMTKNEAEIFEHLHYIRRSLDELRKDIREIRERIEALVVQCAEISSRKGWDDGCRAYVETVSIAPK